VTAHHILAARNRSIRRRHKDEGVSIAALMEQYSLGYSAIYKILHTEDRVREPPQKRPPLANEMLEAQRFLRNEVAAGKAEIADGLRRKQALAALSARR